MTLRVGIISANWGVIAHLPAWRSLEGVEVTSICTSRKETAEAAAQKFRLDRPFWDYEAMCADPDLDIIDCGTRPVLRRGMVLSAVENDKHVYNGIPFAANFDDAREMRDAIKVSNSVGAVDAFSQWLPAHRLMRERLDAGELGELFGGSCRFNTPLFNQPNPQFPFNWFSEGGQGVSAVRNMGSHMLHMLDFLFGPIADVVADDRKILNEWVFPEGEKLIPENNDFANALLRFENGMIMQFQISWNAPLGDGWMIDVIGENGRMTAADPDNFPTSQGCKLRGGTVGSAMREIDITDQFKRAAGVGADWTAAMPAVYPMALSMNAMIDAIDGNQAATPAPDFEQAFRVECVLEAIRISAMERRWVKISEIDDIGTSR